MGDYIPARKFTVSAVYLDENGYYWVGYLGDHVDQGGVSFGWDTLGSEDLDTVLTLLKTQLNKHREKHLQLIAERVKRDV